MQNGGTEAIASRSGLKMPGRGGDHLVAAHELRAAGEIADASAGLGDQQRAGGDVPRPEAHLEEAVEPAGRDVGDVERTGTGAAQRAARGERVEDRQDSAAAAGSSASGTTVPISASCMRVHADVRIGALLSCAPRPLIAVNSSSCTGSRTTACVSSLPCASAIDTAK